MATAKELTLIFIPIIDQIWRLWRLKRERRNEEVCADRTKEAELWD